MALGIDYSFGRPSVSDIVNSGYVFVCRYLASAAGKRIDSGELATLHDAGLSIVLVFEDDAAQALNGQAQGVTDAQEALSQANALGLPNDRPIYFAVDFDASDAQQGAIDDYLRGAGSVLGANRVGVYGGYYVVKRCLDGGTAQWGWQTTAWSGGQLDNRVHIYQNGNSAFGGAADIDESKQADFGQWPIQGVQEDMATPVQIDEAISVVNQVGWGTAPSDAVFSNLRPLLANNFVEGILQILHNADSDPNSAKNRLKAQTAAPVVPPADSAAPVVPTETPAAPSQPIVGPSSLHTSFGQRILNFIKGLLGV